MRYEAGPLGQFGISLDNWSKIQIRGQRKDIWSCRRLVVEAIVSVYVSCKDVKIE